MWPLSVVPSREKKGDVSRLREGEAVLIRKGEALSTLSPLKKQKNYFL